LEVLTIEFINGLANTDVALFEIVNVQPEASGPVPPTEPTFTITETQTGHKTTWTEAFCCLHNKHDQLRIDHDNLQIEVDDIEGASGLEDDGTLPDVSGEDDFINTQTSLLDMIKSLANNLRCVWNGSLELNNRVSELESNTSTGAKALLFDGTGTVSSLQVVFTKEPEDSWS
jgi:hypothetical protein